MEVSTIGVADILFWKTSQQEVFSTKYTLKYIAMNKMLFLFIVTGILLSCYKSNNRDEFPNKLHGKWRMIAYLVPVPSLPELNENDVIWEFNIATNMLTIINNIDFTTPSGEYSINISDETMEIQGIEYDYIIEKNILVLSYHPELDGPIIKFVKK